jgi:MATE family multidrug resistance protein
MDENSLLLEENGTTKFDTYAQEMKALTSLAWPISVANLLQFSITSSSVFSLGHLGTEYLASSALAIMLCNVTGLCVAQGMATALDTLCSQEFTGSTVQFALGKTLQRGIIVSSILCLPIGLLWYYCSSILVLLGQDPYISELAGTFTRWMIPGLFPLFLSEMLKRYLQAQAIMKPGMYMTFMAAILSILLQYLLVWSHFSLGYVGAPIASSIVNFTLPLGLIAYIKFIDGGDQWGGWDIGEMFDCTKIWILLKLGIPGIFMIVSEWLAFEAVALAAGILGKEFLAAQTIVLNTITLLFMIPMGISVATTTRIGNFLGANSPQMAKNIAYAAVFLSIITGLVNSSFLMIVRNYWPLLFTSDETVVQIVKDIFPLAALFQINDGLGAIGGAALRGCGLQRLGACFCLFRYFLLI